MDKKSQNFIRLAEGRTNKIIHTLRLLGNLANRSNYEYTDEQVQIIFSTLEKELRNQKSKFKIKSSRSKEVFKL